MRRRTVVEDIPLTEDNFPAVYDAKLIVDGMILKGIEGLTPLVDQTSKIYHIGIFAGLDSLEAGLEDYLQVTPNSKFLKDNPLAKLDLSFDKFDSPKNVLVGNGQVDKLIENESKTLYITERIEVTKRRLY